MAKEYYKVKTQRIEFDTEKRTMTVTMHDDKFTVISIQTLNEAEFNSQYYRFKADIYSTQVIQEAGVVPLTQQEQLRIENNPTLTDFEDFNQMKNTALNLFNSIEFSPE